MAYLSPIKLVGSYYNRSQQPFVINIRHSMLQVLAPQGVTAGSPSARRLLTPLFHLFKTSSNFILFASPPNIPRV